jgi:carboxymethylenebutenolidase
MGGSTISLTYKDKNLNSYFARPEGEGSFPAVVVIHDALGVSSDLHKQCEWLASEGYLAIAPDLFSGKTFFSCIFKAIREFSKRKGSFFEKIETARDFLRNHPDSTGKVGVIGFCFGGGFALLLSSGYDFDTASVNYGGTLPKDAEEYLKNACPIVASYGKLDRGSKGVAVKLEKILEQHGIEHDVKEYEDTDHAFMNDHDPKEVPLFIKFIAYAFGGGEYHDESCQDARKRIIAFFDKQLKGGNGER